MDFPLCDSPAIRHQRHAGTGAGGGGADGVGRIGDRIAALEGKAGSMKKKINTGVIVLVIGLFAPPFVRAQGTLYVSNLGQTQTGSAPIASDAWIAQLIVTGTNSGGYVLNSVQLLMDPGSGAPGGFTVSIYSNLSGVPNNSLGNFVGTDPAAGGVLTYAASGLALSPHTPYFIVLTASTPEAQGAYDWSATSFTETTGNELWTIVDTYSSSSDGTSWTAHVRNNVFQMALYATPTPEPGVVGLVAFGALFLGLRRKPI
jgi:hypothetical protein